MNNTGREPNRSRGRTTNGALKQSSVRESTGVPWKLDTKVRQNCLAIT
jgi:hypothetical protein